jgi:hypothetical protein
MNATSVPSILTPQTTAPHARETGRVTAAMTAPPIILRPAPVKVAPTTGKATIAMCVRNSLVPTPIAPPVRITGVEATAIYAPLILQ